MNWVRERGDGVWGFMGTQVQRGKDRIHLDSGATCERDGHTGSKALLTGK